MTCPCSTFTFATHYSWGFPSCGSHYWVNCLIFTLLQGNILIDNNHNPRIVDFGYSQTLSKQDKLTYLWSESVRPGAKKWVAPEVLEPDLYPDLKDKDKHTLKGDIYSLGCIILFVSCVLLYFYFPPFKLLV